MNSFYTDLKKAAGVKEFANDGATAFTKSIGTGSVVSGGLGIASTMLGNAALGSVAGPAGILASAIIPIAPTAYGSVKLLLRDNVKNTENIMSGEQLLNQNTDKENELLFNKFKNMSDDAKATFEMAFPGITQYITGAVPFNRTSTPIIKTRDEHGNAKDVEQHKFTEDEKKRYENYKFNDTMLKTVGGAGLGGLAGNYISDYVFDGNYKLPSIIAGALGGGYLGSQW